MFSSSFRGGFYFYEFEVLYKYRKLTVFVPYTGIPYFYCKTIYQCCMARYSFRPLFEVSLFLQVLILLEEQNWKRFRPLFGGSISTDYSYIITYYRGQFSSPIRGSISTKRWNLECEEECVFVPSSGVLYSYNQYRLLDKLYYICFSSPLRGFSISTGQIT